MLGGGVLVVFADTAARVWFTPVELPVGILLACASVHLSSSIY
ncbi:iron chelate uptake ABC transporter family permease subunit [Bacillus sp. SL00103]